MLREGKKKLLTLHDEADVTECDSCGPNNSSAEMSLRLQGHIKKIDSEVKSECKIYF